ncbi:MAG: hypothetical protein Q4G44_06030 [Alcaligenaceae bacterium]|nr:hypothetical protein [Alcaligenaceae bacterium]
MSYLKTNFMYSPLTFWDRVKVISCLAYLVVSVVVILYNLVVYLVFYHMVSFIIDIFITATQGESSSQSTNSTLDEFFTFLKLPILFGLLLALPFVLVLIGLYRIKAKKSFTFFKRSIIFIQFLWIFAVAPHYLGIIELMEPAPHSVDENLLTGIWLRIFVVCFTLFAIHYFLYLPLAKHRMWVMDNGFLATKAEPDNPPAPSNEELVSTLPIEEQIAKWQSLLINKQISLAEFNKIRGKLMEMRYRSIT